MGARKGPEWSGRLPVIKPGSVIGLIGELGAGKTTFVREWVRSRAPRLATRVVSPTFILHARYDLPEGHVHHLDWYRLPSESAVLSVGWEEILTEPFLAVFVEWADKFPDLLPVPRTDIHFRHMKTSTRRSIAVRKIPAGRR